MTRKTPQSHIDNCINEYIAGKSTAQISRESGISKSVIVRALNKAGVQLRPKAAFDREAACAAYIAGASENAVAKQFGVDRGTIRKTLLKAGIEPRDQSAAEALKWKSITGEARKVRMATAHSAGRGRVKTIDEKIKHARTVMSRRLHVSEGEERLAAMLAARGVGTIHQEAIGPYNCDLGAFPVAVEVWGGHWHFHGRHLARTPERFRYILDAGWHILCVVANGRSGHPITDATADYIVAYIEEARRYPTARREYRVVRGAGETLAAGSADDDDISLEWAFTNRRNSRGQYERVAR